MKTLIVYYSLGGYTKSTAEKLKLLFDADLLEIKTSRKKSGLFGGISLCYQGIKSKPAKIMPISLDISAYDLVVVATGVYAGKLSSPVRAFLMQHGKSIKKTAYIITKADKENPFDDISADMDILIEKKRLSSLPVVNGEPDIDSKLRDFADKLMQQ